MGAESDQMKSKYQEWFDEGHEEVILSVEGIPFYKVWIAQGSLQTELINMTDDELTQYRDAFYHEDGSCGV